MRVLVGMSGGVDSAMAAWFLQKAGLAVEGVHVRIHSSEGELDKILRICSSLRISCHVVDRRECMNQEVIAPAVAAYSRGETPSPCLHCNEKVKIKALFDLMKDQKASAVATGHYLRKTRGRYGVLFTRAADARKDQTYMLSRIPGEMGEALLFPLGNLYKTRVLEQAREIFGPLFVSGAESQDLCFLQGHSTIQSYLDAHISPEKQKKGPFRSPEGRILGYHKGIHRYTVGQRKGLGLSGGPWFVYEISSRTGEIRVGPLEKMLVDTVRCVEPNWFVPPEALNSFLGTLRVQMRYQGKEMRVAGFRAEKNRLHVELEESIQGVAPGQGLVMYAEDRMVCGAIIQKTERRLFHEGA